MKPKKRREKEEARMEKVAKKITEKIVIDIGKLTITEDYLPQDLDAQQKEAKIKQLLYKKYPKAIVDLCFEKFYKKIP